MFPSHSKRVIKCYVIDISVSRPNNANSGFDDNDISVLSRFPSPSHPSGGWLLQILFQLTYNTVDVWRKQCFTPVSMCWAEAVKGAVSKFNAFRQGDQSQVFCTWAFKQITHRICKNSLDLMLLNTYGFLTGCQFTFRKSLPHVIGVVIKLA